MHSVKAVIQPIASVTSRVTLERIAAIVYPPISQADNALDQAHAQTDEGDDDEQQQQLVRGNGGHELANPLDGLSDQSGSSGQDGGDGGSSLNNSLLISYFLFLTVNGY